ncbi:MAG TPA: M1 family metallopeptidase [Gemmatimonadales bacterium]|nr:M1 family metallopeptidase [Gemmatimonadales bacterium]
MITLLTVTALALHQSVVDSSPFRALALPAASRVRSSSGAPGPDYWQQEASYTIRATLDTGPSVITGTESIHYVNHAPDALAFVWVQIEQNIFSSNSVTYQLNQPPLHFAGGAVFDFTGKGFIGGITIDHFRVGVKELVRTAYGTMMRVELPAPLAPGGMIDFQVAWHFPVPPYGGGRMGRVGNRLYEIGQWYPRLVVYDDVNGWNPLPYIGAGEFYLEYGNYDVTLTLPAGYLVAATGTIQNPLVVYTPQQRARLLRARSSDSAVAIVTKAEALAAATTSHSPSRTTWHFTATNVRDFAWAASPDFRWDASTWSGIQINTFYRPTAAPWEEANRMARFTIQHFSETWGMYPWPHATTVEGLIEGMEYPMLTFVPSIEKREDQFWVLMHEFGHEWFPMTVGSDERRYPWMDEGFNTFIDYGAAEGYFKGTAYGDTVRRELLTDFQISAKPGAEQPLITKPVEQRDLAWGAYQKPALMLTVLRDQVLGRETFERAMREYVRRWRFKHPQPADFFRTIANVSGRDLDWFWREWIYTTARLDQAIDSVRAAGSDSTYIYLSNRGQMVLPVTLALRYGDGSSETRTLPIEMWNLGDRFTARFATAKAVTGVVLDPAAVLPDMNRGNNSWTK